MIKPITDLGGQAGGDKYIVHNILFKFALDSNGLFGGSDLSAAKGLFYIYLLSIVLFPFIAIIFLIDFGSLFQCQDTN